MLRRNNFSQRPRAAPPAALQVPDPPTRKIFNCIVDDTALIAGVKKSTRDGIRKWVAQRAIRLFVPLHTLNQLGRLKKTKERDANDTLEWLDEVTSLAKLSDYVQLEGTAEQYETWAEVEQFLLPETLLSMEETDSEYDEYDDDMESSFNQNDASDKLSMSSNGDSPVIPTPPHLKLAPVLDSSKSTTDPAVMTAYPAVMTGAGSTRHEGPRSSTPGESPNRATRRSADIGRKQKYPQSTVPVSLQPLFNHILWRIHQEVNADAALETFILLTNDPLKQFIAQRFGIRVKRLEQLRDTIGREDRDYKNRMALYKKENGIKDDLPEEKGVVEEPEKELLPPDEMPPANSDDEDVVLFKRGNRLGSTKVLDPNEFSRAVQKPAPMPSPKPVPVSPKKSVPAPAQNGGARGGTFGRGGHRGRGRGSRGGFGPRGGAYVPPQRYRGPAPAAVDPNQPIDPDSFSRPSTKTGGTRGGRRKLWEPN